MKLLFTICARAGSKGVKSKNSRIFLNYPIVDYTISAYWCFCQKYGRQYECVNLAVNTDSAEVLRQCEEMNVNYMFVPRKRELGGDTVAKPEVIRDTLLNAEKVSKQKYDIVIDMDLTSPLRTADDIEGCIKSLLQKEDIDVAFSVTHARRLPFFNMVRENEEGYFEKVIQSEYVARQQAPACYDMNASIYAYRRLSLLQAEKSNIFQGKCAIWIMKDTAVLDIDSEEDFELLSLLAAYFYDKYPAYAQIPEAIPRLLKKEARNDNDAE